MKASTAHAIAIKAAVAPILAQIKETAENGLFCLYQIKLDSIIVAELERLGYSVKLGTSHTCHYIEWYDIE